MLAWYITRVKSLFTTFTYYLLVFSMIVPFQMVMFTMSKIANILHLDNPVGVIVLYVGFGAGLGSFMFSGFIKTIPLSPGGSGPHRRSNPLLRPFFWLFSRC